MNRQDAKDAKVEPGRTADDLAHSVIGAAIEVHRVLGPGYLESVYEAALSVELTLRGVPFERQVPLAVKYKDRVVGETRIDVFVGGELIVDLKAVEALAPIHRAQMISYLEAYGLPLGLLINFNVPVLKDGIQRIILSGH